MPGLDPNVEFLKKKAYVLLLRDQNGIGLGGRSILHLHPLTNASLKSIRMKLQRHVRGQNRGSWVCPDHLDYFQIADMSISYVFKVDF